MLSLVIWISVILVGVILFTIFRVYTLVKVAKGKQDIRDENNTKWNALMGLIFLVGGIAAFFWYSAKEYDNYVLPVASDHRRAYRYQISRSNTVQTINIGDSCPERFTLHK